jgi:lysozyme
MNRIARGGTAALMAISFIGAAEGLSLLAYPDPATKGAPWTICYGHTGNVKPYQRDSLAQCKALLQADLAKTYAAGIERCLSPMVAATMPDTRYVAVLSLAYNIGVGGFCRSSVARDLNAGNIQAGCDAFVQYNRAAGIVWAGLTRRREEERHLCLE